MLVISELCQNCCNTLCYRPTIFDRMLVTSSPAKQHVQYAAFVERFSSLPLEQGRDPWAAALFGLLIHPSKDARIVSLEDQSTVPNLTGWLSVSSFTI